MKEGEVEEEQRNDTHKCAAATYTITIYAMHQLHFCGRLRSTGVRHLPMKSQTCTLVLAS